MAENVTVLKRITQYRRVKKNKRLSRSVGGDILIFFVLAALGFVMILPTVYIVSTAFKPLDELWMYPPTFLVRNPTLGNFGDMMDATQNFRVPFTRYLFNSLFTTGVGTTLHVIVSSMAAYTFAKHKFPGAGIMFSLIVTSLMFSPTVLAMPTFLIYSTLGWSDTYLLYIAPAIAGPLGLFLMKQFIEQMVPDAVLEAARIDGCSEFRMLFRIVMPMVKPATLTLVIFTMQSLWYMIGNKLIFSESLKTLNYALDQIMRGGAGRAGAGAAAALIIILVPITIFIGAQSNVMTTMASAGVKGE